MSDDNKIINKTLPLKYKVEEGIKNPSTIPIKNNKERCPTKTGHFATGLKNNWQQVEGNWKVTIHKKDKRANNYNNEAELQQEKDKQNLKD